MITTSLYYDDALNDIVFEENFSIIENSNSYLYLDYNNLSDDFNQNDFFEIDKSNLSKIKKLIIHEDIVSSGNLKNNDYALDILDDVESGIYGHNLDDVESLLKSFKIEYTHNYECIVINGHNQNDVAQVLVNKKEFKLFMGIDFIADNYRNHFTNLFFNSPICGDVSIEFTYRVSNCLGIHTPSMLYSVSYDYNEICNDDYEVVINIDYIIKQLPKHVPEDLILKLSNKLESLDYSDVSL